MTNTLYYGDNLDILRQHVPVESVDLVYLDPPFNSNVLFKEHTSIATPPKTRGSPPSRKGAYGDQGHPLYRKTPSCYT